MAFSRRRFLVGAGGAVFLLPFFEGSPEEGACRRRQYIPPFAIFYRRANGVQQSLFNQKQNAEPEGWWPSLVSQSAVNGDSAYGPIRHGRYAPMTAASLATALAGAPGRMCAARCRQRAQPGAGRRPTTRRRRPSSGTCSTPSRGSLGGHPEGFSQGLTGSAQYLQKSGANNGAYCDGSTPHLNTNPHFCGYDDNSGQETMSRRRHHGGREAGRQRRVARQPHRPRAETRPAPRTCRCSSPSPRKRRRGRRGSSRRGARRLLGTARRTSLRVHQRLLPLAQASGNQAAAAPSRPSGRA